MKKILYTLLATSLLISCKKYLDQVPDDKLSQDDTFKTWNTANKFLANVYSHIPDEFGQRDGGKYSSSDNYSAGGVWTTGCDEATFLWDFVRSKYVNKGSMDGNTEIVKSYWTNYYQGIQGASTFIKNADQISNLEPPEITQYKAEARALRAIYYFSLMRIYGPVILLGEEPTSPEKKLQLPRSSVDECVEFITKELDRAAADLPVVPANDDNYGRITKGIALAFKAQTLLYAASPLFNGNKDYSALKNQDGKQLIPQTEDVTKWAKAANAYKAFITEFVPNTYDLYRDPSADYNANPLKAAYLSCRNVMLIDWNKEVIFSRKGSADSRQYELCPRHENENADVQGGTGLAPTQAMVDAFFMANGMSPVMGHNSDGSPIVNAASGYQVSGFSNYQSPSTNNAPVKSTYNQWVNREPRFYVNITYNRSNWINATYPNVETTLFKGGNSGKRADGTGGDYSVTGYVARKAMNTGKRDINDHKVILLRLAEMYLSYAECLNEADYSANKAEVLIYLNKIRERAGIPQYGAGANALPVPANQADMRDAIRKERRVELAFENNRFFDVRRWKIAEQTENGPVYGLNIDATENGGFYNVRAFDTRVFRKEHYFFPIPQQDIDNGRPLVIQNTGY